MCALTSIGAGPYTSQEADPSGSESFAKFGVCYRAMGPWSSAKERPRNAKNRAVDSVTEAKSQKNGASVDGETLILDKF